MELLEKAALAVLVLGFTGFLQFLVIKMQRSRRDHHKQLVFPPGPPSSKWPIVGHLPFFGTGCPHHALAHLAHEQDGLGPIIGLRLGSKLAVVVCNSQLAKEVLHTYDRIMANRPHFTLTDFIFYGYDVSIAFSTYNPRWAMLRKLCTLELFTPKRLQAFQRLRYDEVRTLLASLRQSSCDGAQPVNLGEAFCLMLCNAIGRVINSKTLDQVGGHDFNSLLKVQEHLLAPTIGDFLPWLKFLDLPQKRAMRNHHHRINTIIETMVSHRRQLIKKINAQLDAGAGAGAGADELPQDLLQVLLSKEANINKQQFVNQDELLSMDTIKGTIFDVLSAGTHTTALTLEWVMAELFRNPHCLQKVRDEIDAVMAGKGSDEIVSDEDIPKLPYMEKVVKEAFRLHPSAPMLFPHLASQEVKVDKYTLPANTLVFVNVWALGRDPDVWENPEEFLPERFDDKEIDVKGQHYDLLPFGAGRRACPGIRLAMSVLHVTLANLVRTFDWELPNGQTHMDIDMSEKRGITSMRAVPLLAIPKPRSSTARALQTIL